MRVISLICLFLLTFLLNGFCQSDSNRNKFIISGEILDKDTGTIVLWYEDHENKTRYDTVLLKDGKFTFTGTVNRACEALLWTNLKNRNFDDRSVIRFLLEPKKIFITFKETNEPTTKVYGSKTQKEKENWDTQKSILLISKNAIRKSIDSLYQLSKINNDSTSYNPIINNLTNQGILINEKLSTRDLDYIKNHSSSYLSGYLLLKNNRKLSIDSLQMYYSLLSKNVQKSSFGKKLLGIIYPLTNDKTFRKSNPLFDSKFDKRLNNIKSIYDISLKDTAGNKINFGAFKGKYLVFDFWASWCGPCVANIPMQKKMMEEYKSEPIQFISISVDTDIDKWKQSIKKHDFDGLHLLEPEAFAGLIVIYLKILWVPHYLILDKNGNIINPDAPSPNDPELKILLDNLLKAK